jgi:predicted nuclease of predicted toxin-antitoxin system
VKLKIDENLGSHGAELLLQVGHDVYTVAEQGLCSATDRKLLEVCRAEKMCLVTLDLEFGNPLIFKPEDYSGIAVLRLPHSPKPNDLIDAISALITGLTRKKIEGQLWIIQRGRIREYQPEEEE